MDDKNRFSILLEHLLEVAEVKNYTLAKRLQYDVSYISKWVSGRMLPAKKTEKRVMEGISACVVDEATDDGRDLLLREYSVSIPSDLKAAIYDNLIAEYDYLQEELDSGEARIGPYTDFWAELNMLQYLTKMGAPRAAPRQPAGHCGCDGPDGNGARIPPESCQPAKRPAGGPAQL